jgi:hypothetical protein
MPSFLVRDLSLLSSQPRRLEMRVPMLKIVGVIVGVLNVALIGGGLKAW